MRTEVILMALLFACTLTCAQEDVKPFLKTTWDVARLRDDLRGRAGSMMLSFWMMDRNHNNGKGLSDRAASGNLAWGESSWLMDYIMCYQAFRDPYWLDKVVDHFDRMRTSLSDPEGDGFLAWRDGAYSVGVVRLASKSNADGLTIEPETSRAWVIRDRGGEAVTGHKYSIAFPKPDALVVRDETEDKIIVTSDYKDKIVLNGIPPQSDKDKRVPNGIPGSRFTIAGPARAGARFEFESIRGEEIEYQVHDGMITYPIAQFIEIVFNDPALHEKYKKKADEYLAFIDKHIREKWEPTWVELPDGCGAYVFTAHETQRFPKGLLPHNQYLALARTYLVLKDVKGAPHRDIYLEKAAKMAKYFKKCLRAEGDAYLWNYWDPYPEIPEVRRYVEDTGHGTIDIGFVCEACNRNVVFAPDDLTRFGNTYADRMWNQSQDDPIIRGRVDGAKSRVDGRTIHEYVKLSQWNAKVWDVATHIRRAYPATGNVPSILYMAAGMTGMDAAEINRFHMLRTGMEKALAEGTVINGDFELGGPPEGPPYGWQCGVWSKSKGGVRLVQPGRDSAYALLLEGIPGEGGNVNVVAYPQIRTKATKPTKFRMSIYYRTEGTPKPYFSFLGYGAEESKDKQYDNSPPLEPSTEWRKAEWECNSREGVGEVCFYLRNGGAGKVFYDDFRMERIDD
ncbi:MAG: hypothetical protein AB1696_06905 [Planctomycetota bacterium]